MSDSGDCDDLNDVIDDDIDYWVLRTGVRREIHAVITQHQHVDRVPPFSAAEMLVMAVLCSRQYDLTLSQIMAWILSNFEYYRNQAIQEYSDVVAHEKEEKPENVVDGFHDALDCWEAPFVATKFWGRDMTVSYCCVPTPDMITVPLAHGRIFLRRWLEPVRIGTFSFLELPAELRNTIFKMVLTFPASGMNIDKPVKAGRGVALLQREVDEYPEDLTWDTREEFAHATSAPMQTILALLSVNRQIYEEAMPYFYRNNFFSFDRIGSFVNFANKVPIIRLQHVGHICLAFEPPDASERPDHDLSIPVIQFRSAMATLTKIKTLRKLEIVTHDDDWFKIRYVIARAFGRSRKYAKEEQLPGIRELALAASKAEIFEVHGKCPRIEAYLRQEVERLKAAARLPPVEPKKRGRSQKSTTKCGANVDGSKDETHAGSNKRAKILK